MAGDHWFFTWQGIADELQILVNRGENFVARTVDDGSGWYLPLIGLKRARRWDLKVQNVAKHKPHFQLAPGVTQPLVQGLWGGH